MWAASYCTLFRGIDAKRAASWASLFYIGITIGRFFCGFITMKLNDQKMIRLGQAVRFPSTWLYRKERGNFRTGDLLHFQGTRPDAGRPDRRRMQRLPGMRKERRRIKEKCDCTRPEDVVDWKKNKGVVGGIRDAIRPTTEEKAFLLALYEMTRLICINKYGADRSFSI